MRLMTSTLAILTLAGALAYTPAVSQANAATPSTTAGATAQPTGHKKCHKHHKHHKKSNKGGSSAPSTNK